MFASLMWPGVLDFELRPASGGMSWEQVSYPREVLGRGKPVLGHVRGELH